MRIFNYIGIKVLIFIPLFWLSYIFETDLSYPMLLRIVSLIFCVALIRLISKVIVENVCLTNFEVAPAVIYDELNNRLRMPTLDKGNFLKTQLYYTFNLAFYIGKLIKEKDCLKTSTAILIIIGFMCGNPFINNYTGVRNEVEASRGGYVSGNFHPLYINNEFKVREDAGVFDEFESYSTRTFIFKETGIMSGFYPREYEFWNFYNILKLLFLPFFEACIKTLIWVPLYYLINILIYKRAISKRPL